MTANILPTYSKRATPVIEEMRMVKAAQEMFKRGARVPIVGALLPIKREKLIKLHIEVTGQTPTTGPLPSDHTWYSSNTYPMRTVQSSLLIDIYKKVKRSSTEAIEAEVLVATFDLFINQCSAIKAQPLITFVRAWHLIQQIRINNLITTGCIHCRGDFVVPSDRLHSKYECPLCDRKSSLKPAIYNRSTNALALAA